jgi:MbtH protein
MWSEEDGITFAVVVNHEEQYSIWPADRILPDGWTDAGFQGGRAECLAHIAAVWTDIRPRSLRADEDPASRAGTPHLFEEAPR